MNTQTKDTVQSAPDSAQLSDEQLGNINAACGGGDALVINHDGGIMALFANPVSPAGPAKSALHPNDPGDGTAIQVFRNRGGGGSI